MQIDCMQKMKEGWCFICDEKGHILKNCPMKSQKKEVRALEMAEVPLSMDTKIEEVKE